VTDAYVYTNPTNDPDAFDVVANGLTVGRLRRLEDGGGGWRLEAAASLIFAPVDFDADLDASAAQSEAVDWIGTNQSEELDELFD
jgi:predicted secreted protein